MSRSAASTARRKTGPSITEKSIPSGKTVNPVLDILILLRYDRRKTNRHEGSCHDDEKRAGAYWGLHFDFHAIAATKGIGTRTTAENIGAFLDATRPDCIRLDTKGHPGYTSFFSDYGDVAPAWKLLDFAENGGNLLVNLINTAEYYYDVYGSGACELPPVYGLTIAVKADHAPASVTFQPEGRPAEWTNRDGYVHVKVPKLDIHTILVLE